MLLSVPTVLPTRSPESVARSVVAAVTPPYLRSSRYETKVALAASPFTTILSGPHWTTRIESPGHSPKEPLPTMKPVSSVGGPKVAASRPSTVLAASPKLSGPMSLALIVRSAIGMASPMGVTVVFPVPSMIVTVVLLDPSATVVLLDPAATVVLLDPSATDVVVALVVVVVMATVSPPLSMKKAMALIVVSTSPTASPTSTGLAWVVVPRRGPPVGERPGAGRGGAGGRGRRRRPGGGGGGGRGGAGRCGRRRCSGGVKDGSKVGNGSRPSGPSGGSESTGDLSGQSYGPRSGAVWTWAPRRRCRRRGRRRRDRWRRARHGTTWGE